MSGPSPTFVVDTDIPSSIGLASSSAGVVAAAIAVNSRFALGLSEEQILRIAYETEFVGTGGGGMDHIASVSADVSVTDGCDGFLPRRSEGRYEWKADWLVSLVIPPGTKDCRNHIKEVRSWQKYDPARIGAYRSAVTVASKMILRAIDQDDIALLGASMDAAHQAMRDLFAMSTETLETERSKVLRAGAAGVKLTGSGGGGCLVVVTQQDRHPEFVEQWLGLRSNASAARLVSNVGRHREKIG
ncbi:GHMP family kinase ATP-binding protein [Rhodococcus sp. MEB064]|uniref:GHMP family kinase ATP-binding protein n=1 Tax=Rhodococcus sp. MEB064 TaxID=1587522 RepID=UPI0012E0A841